MVGTLNRTTNKGINFLVSLDMLAGLDLGASYDAVKKPLSG